MRLSSAQHQDESWVISQLAHDFTLLDAWAVPVRGDREDFPAFLEVLASLDPTHAGSALTRTLFWVRLRLGALLGWDDTSETLPIPGCAETTLRTRLPAHLRDTAATPAFGAAIDEAAGGFSPLYRTDREWAAEISNATVHGVVHLAWVAQLDGGHRPQMGVYVKPRGRLGVVYLRLIEPFRHLVVYPALMRQIACAWADRPAAQEAQA